MGSRRQDHMWPEGALWACEGPKVGFQNQWGAGEAPQNKLGVEGGTRVYCSNRFFLRKNWLSSRVLNSLYDCLRTKDVYISLFYPLKSWRMWWSDTPIMPLMWIFFLLLWNTYKIKKRSLIAYWIWVQSPLIHHGKTV